MLNKLLSSGGIAALLTVVATGLTWLGQDTLAQWVGSPEFAADINTLIAVVGSIVSGFLSNQRPAPTA